ncbi:MAG TPA: riboflavin kinase, partial [Patescibacteria group bacterium]|nr:riboflavin kinase [Patescibacteria group bacterium]
GTATVGGKSYRAGIVIGPLDRRGLPKLEAHLLGFAGNLYGRSITLTLKRYLRPFRRYAAAAAISRQIERDLALVRQQ